MTQYLPPNLLALFAPRDPIPYLPPVGKLTWEKKTDGYTGIAQYLNRFEDPKDTPPPTRGETREERIEKKRREKAEQMQYKLEQEIAIWDPTNNESGTTDPYKTLFISRINYDTSESKLRREFEIYGPVKKIVMTHNVKTGKPRGYAFIEYEHERDMHSTYKHADGKKIDNRRVLVDVERARTVKGWLPRRLGGGLGGTRRGGPDVNVKHSGRDDDRKKGRDDERPERGERAGGERAGGGGEREDRARPRRDRSRSRDRERERRPRRSRSRDRERKRRRSRTRDQDVNPEEVVEGVAVEAGKEREPVKERRRRRSRSRERKRRSRSRDRKHRRDRDRKDRPAGEDGEQPLKIKQEPEDDYPDYSGESYANNFPLKDEDERAKNGAEPPTEQQPKFEEDAEEQTNEIDY